MAVLTLSAPPSLRRQALLLVAAAALSSLTLLRGYGPHDEGLMLQWAQRIADGQWPYRDFWSNYLPGQPLLLAGLVKLLGPSLLWWRIVRVALDAVVALEAYRLVRRDAGERWALGAWLAVAGAMAWPTGPAPNPAALALGLGGVLLARTRPAAGGALAGAAVFFQPEIGLAAALGAALEARREGALRALAAAAAVAVVLLLPFAIVAGAEMARQVVGFLGIQDLQRLPFPWPKATLDPNKLLESAFPLLLLAGAGVWLLAVALTRPPARGFTLVPLGIVGAAYLLGRADEFHLVPLSVAVAAGAALAAPLASETRLRVALAAVVAVIALHGLDRRAGEVLHPPLLSRVPADVADGVKTSPADAAALRRLLPAVRALAPHREPVLVTPPRFDRVRVGDPMLNVLLGRPNPTRYDVMQPGVVTTPKVQREMLSDLLLSRTPVVIRWEAPAAWMREPNGSGRSSGVTLLDRAIRIAYRPVARYGDYVVLVRRGRR